MMSRLLLALVLVLLAACGPTDPQITPTGAAVEVDELENTGPAIADADQSALEDTSLGASQPNVMVDTSSQISGNIDTFTGDGMNFSFDYPSDWYVQGDTGNPVILTSFEPEDLGQGGIDPDQTKIDFVPVTETGTVEERAAARRQEIEQGGGEIRQDGNYELAQGYNAVRMLYYTDEGREQIVLVTEVEGQPLLIAGYGNLLLFDPIVNSLRPALEVTQEATEEN